MAFDLQSRRVGHHPNSSPHRFNYGSRPVSNHVQGRKLFFQRSRQTKIDTTQHRPVSRDVKCCKMPIKYQDSMQRQIVPSMALTTAKNLNTGGTDAQILLLSEPILIYCISDFLPPRNGREMIDKWLMQWSHLEVSTRGLKREWLAWAYLPTDCLSLHS